MFVCGAASKCWPFFRHRLASGTDEKIQLSSMVAAFQAVRDLVVSEASQISPPSSEDCGWKHLPVLLLSFFFLYASLVLAKWKKKQLHAKFFPQCLKNKKKNIVSPSKRLNVMNSKLWREVCVCLWSEKRNALKCPLHRCPPLLHRVGAHCRPPRLAAI